MVVNDMIQRCGGAHEIDCINTFKIMGGSETAYVQGPEFRATPPAIQ